MMLSWRHGHQPAVDIIARNAFEQFKNSNSADNLKTGRTFGKTEFKASIMKEDCMRART